MHKDRREKKANPLIIIKLERTSSIRQICKCFNLFSFIFSVLMEVLPQSKLVPSIDHFSIQAFFVINSLTRTTKSNYVRSLLAQRNQDYVQRQRTSHSYCENIRLWETKETMRLVDFIYLDKLKSYTLWCSIDCRWLNHHMCVLD